MLPEQILLGIGFFLSGLLLFLLVWSLLRTITRTNRPALPHVKFQNAAKKKEGAAALMIEAGGRIQNISETALELFDLPPDQLPNIEMLGQRVQPVERFIELCAAEGHAHFLVNGKMISAVSYQIPDSAGSILLIFQNPNVDPAQNQTETHKIQRDMQSSTVSGADDLGKSLSLEVTAETILLKAAQLIPADFIEIKTWDESGNSSPEIFRLDNKNSKNPSITQEETSLFANISKQLPTGRKELSLPDTRVLGEKIFDPTNHSEHAIGSYIGIPFFVGDQLIGTLEAGAFQPNRLEIETKETLETISKSATAALHKAITHEAQLRWNQKLTNLTNLAQEIGSIRSADDLFPNIVNGLGDFFDFEIIGVLQYVPQALMLEAQIPFLGLPDNIVEVYKIHADLNTHMQQTIRTQKIINTTDAKNDPIWAQLGLQDMALAASIRDTTLVPLLSAGNFLGYLQLSNHRKGKSIISQDERQLLEIVSVQIAANIEFKNLLHLQQQNMQRIDGIQSINTIVTSTGKLDDILQKAMLETGKVFQADVGAIFILDEIEGIMHAHIPSVFGVPNELAGSLSKLNTQPTDFEITVTGSQLPFISGDLENDQRVLPIYQAIVTKLNLVSGIVAPLIVQGKSLGELMLGARKSNHFNTNDLKITATIAGHVAILIENARHSGETDTFLQRRSDFLTIMNRISREIKSAANLNDLARVVYEECLLVTGTTCGGVTLFSDTTAENATGQTSICAGHSDLQISKKPSREILESGEIRLVSSFSENQAPHAGINSALFSPIGYQGEYFGLIELHAFQADGFDETVIEMIRDISIQSALAARDLLRFQQQQTRSNVFHNQTEALLSFFETSGKLGFDASLGTSLQTLSKKMKSLTPYDQIQISLYDPQTYIFNHLTSVDETDHGPDNILIPTQTWDSLSGFLTEEFRSGHLYISPSIGHSQPGIQNHTVRIPIRNRNQDLLGLIHLTGARTGQQPDLATKEMLEIFASETAAIIENGLTIKKFQAEIEILKQEVARQEKAIEINQKTLPVLLQKDLEQTLEMTQLIQRARHIRASLQVTETISRQLDPSVALLTLGQQVLTSFNMTLTIVARDTSEGPQIVHVNGSLPGGANPETSFGQRNPLRTCLQTGETLVVENLEQDDTWRDTPLLTNLHAKSFFCIPIVINHKPIAAVLAIDTDVMPRLTAEDHQVYSQAGKQISIILQNIGLLNETRQRLDEVNLLLDFNRNLIGLNPREILKALLDSALRVVTPAHAGFVLLPEQHSNVLIPVAVSNYVDDEILMSISFRQGEGLPGQVFEGKKPRRIDEVNFVSDYNLLPENLLIFRKATGGRLPVSSLIMPIMTGAQVWGILVLDNFNTPAAFRAEDEAILLSLSQQVALSLENVRLMQTAQERAGQLQALNSVSAILTANLQRQELLTTLLDRMASIIPYDTAILWLRQENKMVVADARGFNDSEERKGLTVEVADSALLNEMTRTGQAIVVNDVRNDPRFISLIQPDYLDWMGIPLIAKGVVIGVLAIEKAEANFYTNELMQLSVTFASQATVAIDNATLYEESTRRASELDERSQRLGLLNKFSAELGGLLSADQVLLLTVTQLLKALQVEQALLIMLDEKNQDYLIGILPGENRQSKTYQSLPSSTLLEHLREAQTVYAAEEVSLDHNLDFLFGLLEDTTSVLILPLFSSTKRYAIVLQTRETRRFKATEIELARTICNQASIALENANLYQSTLSTAEHLSILNQASHAIGASLKTEDIYTAAHEAIIKLMPVDAFLIAMLSDNDSDVEGVYVVDMGKRITGMRTPYGTGVSGQVIATGKPVLLQQASEAEAMNGIPIGEKGIPNSIIAVPMILGGKVIGMISAQSYQPKAYTRDDQQILSTLANQVTVAILNARLLTETQNLASTLEQRVTERTSQLKHEQHNTETLLRVLTEVTSSLDLDHALNRTLTLLNDAIGAEQGTIMLLHVNDNKLYFRAGFDVTSEISDYNDSAKPGQTTSKISETLVDWVVKNRKPMLVNDLEQDQHWLAPRIASQYRSALVTPLLVGDAVIGAILAFHRATDYFGEESLDIVKAIGSQVAIAINNAQLYELIRDQAERLGTMLRQQNMEASRQTAILEAVADGILVTDSANKINFVNDSVKQMLGVSRDQMQGQALENFAGLFGKNTQTWVNTVKDWSTTVSESTAGATYAEQIDLENGRVALVHLAPVVWHNEFLGTVSIFRDITHEVEVDRLKSEFVATVSHELRTPMTSIRGYIDLLLMGAAGAMNENQKHFVQIVKNNTERLNILVNDLLDVSKIETGRVMLSFQPVDLREVAQKEMEKLEQRSKKEGKQKQFMLESETKLPRVLADAERIHQILGNLMDNAYNYTPENGTIKVCLHKENADIQIDVIDTGIGITQEQKDRIFERFYRGDDPLVLATPGTGLGLPIVKQLIEMHHGKIWMESSGIPGQGSKFSFSLPVPNTEE